MRLDCSIEILKPKTLTNISRQSNIKKNKKKKRKEQRVTFDQINDVE